MAEKAKKKSDYYWMHMIIMFVLMLGFGQLPPFDPITEVGMKVLGIFLGMLYGYTFIGMALPSLLGITFVGFSGIAANCKTVYMAAFGNDNFIFIVFVLIFVGILDKLNVVDYIANWLMTRRILSGKPWLFSYTILLGTLLMGMIAQPFPAIFFFWGVTYKVCETYGYQKQEPWPAFMIIGVCVAAIFSMCTCPWRAYVIVLLGTYSSLAGGSTVEMLPYFLFLLPITLLLLAVLVAVGKYILKIDVAPIKSIDVEKIIAETPNASKEQKIGLVALAAFLVIIFAPTLLPASWKLTALLNTLGSTGICILAVALMLIVRNNGVPVTDLQEAGERGMSWEIFAVGFCLISFVGYLTNAATGIPAFLNLYLGELLSGFSGYLLVGILVACAAALTNVSNNMVVAAIIMTLGFMLAPTAGIDNTALMAVMIIYGSCFGFLTPAACPYIAVAFGNKEWVKPTQIYKYGAIAFVAFLIVFLTVGFVWGNIVI